MPKQKPKRVIAFISVLLLISLSAAIRLNSLYSMGLDNEDSTSETVADNSDTGKFNIVDMDTFRTVVAKILTVSHSNSSADDNIPENPESVPPDSPDLSDLTVTQNETEPDSEDNAYIEPASEIPATETEIGSADSDYSTYEDNDTALSAITVTAPAVPTAAEDAESPTEPTVAEATAAGDITLETTAETTASETTPAETTAAETVTAEDTAAEPTTAEPTTIPTKPYTETAAPATERPANNVTASANVNPNSSDSGCWICLGEYKLTAYCPCVICCGIWSADDPSRKGTGYVQRTASGTIPTAGRTIGVDPKIIPYGTVVLIKGHEYIAEDTGSALLNKSVIDIFMNTHEEATEFGVQKAVIYIKR